MKSVNILNISIDNLSMIDLIKKLEKTGGCVFTPNVDHLMKLHTNRDFFQIYSTADYKVCDSKILMFASKIIGQPIKEKISGSDLFPTFYEYYKEDKNIKIFLLGGPEGVADLARKKINDRVERQIIVDSYSPPFGFEKNEAECKKIIDLINDSGATVLAVGLGAPKQEKWIYEHKNKLKNVTVFLAIGATIEFEAGYRRRSPKWMSEVGLEWLYRLICEPKRLSKRYLIESLPFFWLLLQQKLNIYQNPFAPEEFEFRSNYNPSTPDRI